MKLTIKLFPYLSLVVLITLFLIKEIQDDKLYTKYTKTLWHEAYQKGRINQALGTMYPNHNKQKQFIVDSLEADKQIKMMFR